METGAKHLRYETRYETLEAEASQGPNPMPDFSRDCDCHGVSNANVLRHQLNKSWKYFFSLMSHANGAASHGLSLL